MTNSEDSNSVARARKLTLINVSWAEFGSHKNWKLVRRNHFDPNSTREADVSLPYSWFGEEERASTLTGKRCATTGQEIAPISQFRKPFSHLHSNSHSTRLPQFGNNSLEIPGFLECADNSSFRLETDGVAIPRVVNTSTYSDPSLSAFVGRKILKYCTTFRKKLKIRFKIQLVKVTIN